MTIYRMYADNGNRAGFWVQHRSWRNTCAQVESVAGQRNGKLPGNSPLYDNAAVVVRCFDVRSGRPLQPGPQLETPQDSHYRIIAQPGWYRGAKEVPAAVGSA
jgi:hypothetical protein